MRLRLGFARLALLALGLSLAGCASPGAMTGADGVDDPFEPMNRSVFDTYLLLDRHAFRPIALTYREVIPEPIRRSEQNFVNNFDSPVIMINDVLRGRMVSAGTTLLRAAINSTAGASGQ